MGAMGTLTIFILVMMAIIIIPSLRPPKNKLLENMEIEALKKELKMYKDSEAMDKDAMEYTAEDDASLKQDYSYQMAMTEEEHMEAMEDEYGDPDLEQIERT
tara:strand:+ start:1120 stop:1425 length:306 start_codon:yes stop_codon:yes gene_type:complete